MENPDKSNIDLLSTEQLEVNEQSAANFKDAALWAKTIAIIGVIIGGLAIIGVLFYGVFSGTTSSYYSGGYKLGVFIGIVIVIAIGLIGIINLFKFSSGMATGTAHQDATAFEKGITGLKYYFIFIGIITLVFTFISLIQLIR